MSNIGMYNPKKEKRPAMKVVWDIKVGVLRVGYTRTWEVIGQLRAPAQASALGSHGMVSP
jgi:hypothetical protein